MSLNSGAMKTQDSFSLNPTIIDFGREIFKAIGKEQPSTFNKNYWSGQMMEWAMKRPEFKVNLFRLVDVLPALTNAQAVSAHIREYLGSDSAGLPWLMRLGIKAGTVAPLGTINAFFVRQIVRQMASQFIAGESPQRSLSSLKKIRQKKIAFTVDLLGEYSLSEIEARAYLDRYLEALDVMGSTIPTWPEAQPIIAGHCGERTPVCVSVKLTALYSQCSSLNFERSVGVLTERLTEVACKARKVNAQVYVDAEDSASNPIILETFKRVFSKGEFIDLPCPGIVLQAYSKNSEQTLIEIIAFAKSRAAPIAVRLVKGAYWDHETTICRQHDWPSPLFAKKESTDANYERLSRILIDNHKFCLPALASHNVRSLAHGVKYAEQAGLTPKDFELQMLYGMADPISQAFSKQGYLVRLYVPLGKMLPGMGYLVRRLLENTSNESFLRHTFFDQSDVDSLLNEPKAGE